ncbi:tripartite tricarboxylate transporter substrate binding protein [Hydrogenophaga sp.]|uniref:Bug family tripartite tricarboxylate transporter substrate binding protein n=1 Tax=Hydrogenophaga sp. TaxID=1904254 RepID=UPI00271B7D40|nr:tripartite tricarboxylate transporter substrate binding protein [Hydrogenophaga sp.]MDO9438883.1 tripartite tricarboxylate transporter substrate binding protein [Hydrogenophaga sp.]
MFHRFASNAATLALSLCCAAIGTTAMAQTPPQNDTPIRLIVGFAAGGPTDILARLIGTEASTTLKQPVVVENLTGASGNLATMAVRRAAPNGNTLLVSSLTHNVNPLLIPDASKYDPIADFTPVSQALTLFQALVVAHDSPVNSVAELIEQAKSRGSLTYASAGVGGSSHLASALLASRSATQLIHVPFRGNAPAMTEVMAGRVDFMFYPMVGLAPMVAEKRLKVLAVTNAERNPDYPAAPTMAEAGFAGFDKYSNYIGFMAPRGTPPDVVERLNAAIRLAMKKPAVKEQLRALGAVEVGSTSKDFAAFLLDDRKRWAELISSAKIKGE